MLAVAIGSMAGDVLEAAASVRRAGYTVRVVAPRWVSPVDPELIALAAQAELVVAQANVRSEIGQARGLRFKLQHAIENVDNQVAQIRARVATWGTG